MTTKYPLLLSPGKIGSIELRNKTVMSAMGMNQSTNGFVNEAVINHYAEHAKGGVGLIVVEVTCVDSPVGLNTANMLVIDDDKFIPGMTKLADAIHKEGSKCVLQISHTGRGARRAITGHQPVAPSAVAMPYSFMMGLENEEPIELTIDEIHEIEEKYAQAALRAKKAGFDGVEIHSVGYYLGEQFLSSTANVRTDEYGGNPENRVRFHLNIIKRIRELCGDDFTIIVKYSAMERGEDAGITMEDGIYYAKRFQDAGVDALEVLAGTWKKEASMEDLPDSASNYCQAVGLCQALKYGILKMTGKPATIAMIGGGRAQNPDIAEKALEDKQCEFIFLGHSLLAEPNLVNLIIEDRQDEIRPCIGCGTCVDTQLQSGGTCCCSGNAVIGQGSNDYTITPTEEIKNVVVIGGGVAGVEAARIAAKRGHKVSLYEKDDKIGGQLYYAVKPPHKQNMELLIPYLERQLEVTGVDVHLNTEISAEEIINMSPDAVICATGVHPAKLSIPGFEHAVNAKEVLDGKEVGEKIVIIGGGSVGIETAELLASMGKKVTIIEMMDKLADKMVNVTRTIVLGHLREYGVDFKTSCLCQEIKNDSVVCKEKDGTIVEIPANDVIIAIGDRPETSLYEELKGRIPEVYNVGDSASGGTIAKGVNQAYNCALNL